MTASLVQAHFLVGRFEPAAEVSPTKTLEIFDDTTSRPMGAVRAPRLLGETRNSDMTDSCRF